jgi:CTP:molybdopterin cytidylyltransferase MocA
LKSVVDFGIANPEKICQPVQGGHRRHPIWLPRDFLGQLQYTPEITLKDFLDDHASSCAFCELTDPGLELDIDYPADYERALLAYSESGP